MTEDPLRTVLRSVRRVGSEFCWPATEAIEVLGAFERLGKVILGAELWRFDEDAPEPTVVGWTEYEVPDGTCLERVVGSHRLAADELLMHSEDLSAWINLTWDDCGDYDPLVSAD